MNLVECKYSKGPNRGVEDSRWVDPINGKVYSDRHGACPASAIPHHYQESVQAFVNSSGGSVLIPVPAPPKLCTPNSANVTADAGQKFDSDKDEPGLLMNGCVLAVQGVIAVLAFGFRKYGKRNGWKEVPEAKRRYKDALYRHLSAIERGELIDPESGKPHWDHVACNAMFQSQMHHEDGSYE